MIEHYLHVRSHVSVVSGMKVVEPTFLRVMKEHDRKEVASHVFGLLIQIREKILKHLDDVSLRSRIINLI